MYKETGSVWILTDQGIEPTYQLFATKEAAEKAKANKEAEAEKQYGEKFRARPKKYSFAGNEIPHQWPWSWSIHEEKIWEVE